MSCAAIQAKSPSTIDPSAGSQAQPSCAGSSQHELLPGPFTELAASGDIGAQITTLLVKASREQRSAAHEARAAAEKAQLAADDQELSAMKEEADDRFKAGLIAGGTQIASGAMSMGGNGYGQAAAKMTEGSGKVASSIYEQDASYDGVEAKKDAQISGREKTAVDDARDLDKDAKQMLDRALGYYKEYLTAKSDTMRATLLRA